MIPNNITKEHLEKAIEEIDKNGIKKGRHSSTYDLIYNGKSYPPKLVISIANRFANGSELESNDFSGGKGTEAFELLEKFNFQIMKKSNSKIISDFQKYLSKFHKNKSTSSEYLKMMPKIEKWLINTKICNPDFNIWNDIFEINEINKSLKSKYADDWRELNKNEKNWYSAPWNKWVDFNKTKKPNYWIFQGNPKVFDFEKALRQELLTDWTVSAHKDKIHVGDKVILWITGNKSGCYALAELTSEPRQKTSSPDDHLWKEEDKSVLKANIKITHNLVDKPILKESIDLFEELKDLKVGNQGTNFSATEEEYRTIFEIIQNNTGKKYWLYAPGENASKWEEFYGQGIMGLGWDEIGDLNLLGDRDNITKTIQDKYNTESKSYNNALANLEFRDIISEGDIIIPKKGRQDYLGYGIVVSGYYYDSTRESYQKCRKVDWKKKGVWVAPKGDIVLKTLTDITKYPDYVNKLIKLIGIEQGENIQNVNFSGMKLEDYKTETFNHKVFQKSLEDSGLIFENKIITRFIASLTTKPFVLLSGLSGSGKTKLAQAFAQWICQDDSQYCIVPVGADWTNREPLLGYPNALKSDEYIKPDNGALDLIIEANNHPDFPYFLILDEMNLSHVERYFADFLSVMETKGEISLFAEGMVNNGVPAKLSLPTNLFIVGTVNIDETTYMFSPKVLDRANAIEFRVTKDEIENYFANQKEVDMNKLKTQGASMAQSFLSLAENNKFQNQDLTEIHKTLVNFFEQLKKTGAEFGYRSATEIVRLINQLSVIDNGLSENEKLDIAIMQKLLPKLHGSRRKLCSVLIILGGFCVNKTKISNIEKDVFAKDDFDFLSDAVLYPISLEKITRMYKGAIENGFTSYAEA